MSLEKRQIIRDVLLPVSLLRAPEKFGGTRERDCLRGDLIVEGGRAVGLATAHPSKSPAMLIPALVEAHCHLDKCHSINRIEVVGGDLSTALETQRRDKANWTTADLRRRMARGVSELSQAGCNAVRSHIDWGETASPPTAWPVLLELIQDQQQLKLQGAALTSVAQIADRQVCFDIAKNIAPSSGALGCFILHHDLPDIMRGLANAFAAADQFGLSLDFHVDEGLGDYNGLEIICDMALKTGFQGPVLCGHAVSLMERTGDGLKRILDKLASSGIAVCALPTTNLYLQGRNGGTPDRRGLTRLRELQQADVPIIVASDNVADAFCPMGQHDPRAALHLAALAGHLDPPMGDWLPAITSNPARAMGLEALYMDNARLEDLRQCDVSQTADLVSGRKPLFPIKQPLESLPQ